jgi:hypothetical protein
MFGFLRRGYQAAAPDKSGKSGTGLGFRIAPDVKASLHEGGVVLIHLSRGTVFSANRVGATIWNAAAEDWSLDRVVGSISSEFHIPPQIAKDDATEFLAQLAAEGLLVCDAH